MTIPDPFDIILESLLMGVTGTGNLPPELAEFNCCHLFDSSTLKPIIDELMGQEYFHGEANATLAEEVRGFLGIKGRDLEQFHMAHEQLFDPAVRDFEEIANSDALGTANVINDPPIRAIFYEDSLSFKGPHTADGELWYICSFKALISIRHQSIAIRIFFDRF